MRRLLPLQLEHWQLPAPAGSLRVIGARMKSWKRFEWQSWMDRATSPQANPGPGISFSRSDRQRFAVEHPFAVDRG